MTNRRSSDRQAERRTTKKKRSKILFHVLTEGHYHCSVYKLDLNHPHFYATQSSSFPNYASLQINEDTWPYRKIVSSRSSSKLSSRSRPFTLSRCSSSKLSSRSRPFGLSRCSSKRSSKFSSRIRPFGLSRCSSRDVLGIQKKKKLVPSTFTIGKLNRHLQFQPRTDLPPLIPRYMGLDCRDRGFPEYMAMASLGSKIYLIGGFNSSDVYVIDTSNSHPRVSKMSSKLNSKKHMPIAWTIHGKIYVMPLTFTAAYLCKGFPPGIYFECFDPDSNSWTVLPDPPFVGKDGSYPRSPVFENEKNVYGRDSAGLRCGPFSVKSYAVVGTILLISIAIGGVFAFDTARPDRGWRKIVLSLGMGHPRRHLLLNFLPFLADHSFPLREGLVFSQLDYSTESRFLSGFLQSNFPIRNMGFYVCSFDDLDALSDPGSSIVKISIRPVTGITPNERWMKFVKYPTIESPQATRIEDGLVLVSEVGYQSPDDGDFVIHYCFNVFRIQRVVNSSNDCDDDDDRYHYEASRVSSALFRGDKLRDFTDCSHSWLFKDGSFSN